MISHNLKVKIQTVNDQMYCYHYGRLIDLEPTISSIVKAIHSRMCSNDSSYFLIYIDKESSKNLFKDLESLSMRLPSLSGIEPDEFGYLGKLNGVNIITDAGSVEKYIKGCKLLVSDFPIILNAELIQQRKIENDH